MPSNSTVDTCTDVFARVLRTGAQVCILECRVLYSAAHVGPVGFPRRQNTARGRESMHECCVYATSANTECHVSMYSFLCRNLYFALLILSYIFLRDCTLSILSSVVGKYMKFVFAHQFFCVLSQFLTYISRNSVLQNTWVLKKKVDLVSVHTWHQPSNSRRNRPYVRSRREFSQVPF